MKYDITIERSALKTLQKIQHHHRVKIIEAIELLATMPRPIGAKSLSDGTVFEYVSGAIALSMKLMIINSRYLYWMWVIAKKFIGS